MERVKMVFANYKQVNFNGYLPVLAIMMIINNDNDDNNNNNNNNR